MTLNISYELSKTDQAILIAVEKGYQITDSGDVIGAQGKKLKLKINTQGYHSFSIKVDFASHAISIPVHRFQAFKKYGLVVFDKSILIRHLDGDQLNNSFDNVRIGNQSDNMLDVSAGTRTKKAIKAASSKRRFTDEQIAQIRKDRDNGMTYKQLGKKYNVAKSTLSYLFNNAFY